VQSRRALAVVLLAASSALADGSAAVSWETLAQVSVSRQKDRYVAEFSRQVLALDKREVKLRGFMLPLEQGAGQRRFVIDFAGIEFLASIAAHLDAA